MSESSVAPVLEISGLQVYYGRSHAVQDVDMVLDRGVLSLVGRNGMGKTTLCKAIMGLLSSRGSIRIGGDEVCGLSPHVIAKFGVGYVPQGRRLWPSLSVGEHLALAARRGGNWTPERVFDAFPRLAERRRHGGARLSGGEQQMLAIARALLGNPRLLIMDEPTEGLAPVIVRQVEGIVADLVSDGEMAVLLVEQNMGVATGVSERVAVMVNGRIARVMDSETLAADRHLQKILLGAGSEKESASCI